ncbi:MAG: carotenoid oxygenase family protein [Pseudomonadota bacterium]
MRVSAHRCLVFKRRPPNFRYQSIPFSPVKVEYTHTEFDVDGQIPRELCGLYVRNGPNPAGKIGRRQHYFSGDGMVHGVRLEHGKAVWYRNRFVRVGQVPEALGVSDPGGPISNGLDVSPNTNIVKFGTQLYASIEAGPSLVLLTDELATVRRSDLNGVLSKGFTGHHKIDPTDGDIHAIVYSDKLGKNALYLRLSPGGELTNEVKIPLAGRTQIHDMSITQNYAIVYDLNVEFDWLMLLRTSLPIRWKANRPSRVGIIPKNGSTSDVRWFNVKPSYVYHPVNAFETDDGKLILDVSRYARTAEKDYFGPLGDVNPLIFRWTIDLDASESHAREEVLFNLSLDFPKVNPSVEGRPYRFAYGIEATTKPSFDAAVKMDLKNSTSERQSFDGGMASELTFIPRENSRTEDDGWLMGFVYQPDSHRSRLVILDAQKFSQPPEASIWIPEQHVPIGTHGGWFPDALL